MLKYLNVNKEVKEVTQSEMESILSEAKGATIVTASTETSIPYRKGRGDNRNPFYDPETGEWTISRVSNVNGIMNWDYEGSVNRQLQREGKETEFEAKEHPWGEHVEGTPFIKHKFKDDGNLYLQLKQEAKPDPEYNENPEKSPKGSFLFHKESGEPLNEEELEELKNWQSARSKSSRQGTEKEIMVRDLKMERVVAINMSGVTYVIKRDEK